MLVYHVPPGHDGNIAVTLPPQVKTQTNLSWGISGDARCAICNIGRADRRSRCSRCRDRHAVSRAVIAIVTVTARARALSRQLSTSREGARSNQVSCCDGILPLRRRFGSEGPQRGSGDEVALKIECVVDGGMDAEEALGRSS